MKLHPFGSHLSVHTRTRVSHNVYVMMPSRLTCKAQFYLSSYQIMLNCSILHKLKHLQWSQVVCISLGRILPRIFHSKIYIYFIYFFKQFFRIWARILHNWILFIISNSFINWRLERKKSNNNGQEFKSLELLCKFSHKMATKCTNGQAPTSHKPRLNIKIITGVRVGDRPLGAVLTKATQGKLYIYIF